MTAAKQGTLVTEPEEPQTQALAPQSTAGEMTALIERLATNRDVDVEKLERIIGLHERVLAHQAKAAYDASFAKMQPDLPEISERGKILVRGELRSTYARLEDIQAAIKPVLKVHGFALRHRTEWPEDRKGIIRIVGILSHEQGHSEESIFEAPMDRSDYRTDIQSMGSTVSYGRRYTTLDLLNISTRGADDDGQSAGKPPAADVPVGYADWLTDLLAAADEGFKRYSEAWNASKPEFRNFVMRHDKETLNRAKAKAQEIDRKARS